MWVIYLFLKSKTLPHIKPSEIHLHFCESDQRLSEFSFGLLLAIKPFETLTLCINRSSPPEVFSRKGVLKICSKFTPMPRCDFNKQRKGDSKKNEIKTLKKSCQLFAKLCISYQVCDENNSYPQSLSKNADLRSRKQSNLLTRLEEVVPAISN